MESSKFHSNVAEVLSPIGVGEKISISGANAAGTIVFDGMVDITSNTDCFINVGAAAVADTNYYMLAGFTYRFTIKGVINAITSGGTGELQCHPVISAD